MSRKPATNPSEPVKTFPSEVSMMGWGQNHDDDEVLSLVRIAAKQLKDNGCSQVVIFLEGFKDLYSKEGISALEFMIDLYRVKTKALTKDGQDIDPQLYDQIGQTSLSGRLPHLTPKSKAEVLSQIKSLEVDDLQIQAYGELLDLLNFAEEANISLIWLEDKSSDVARPEEKSDTDEMTVWSKFYEQEPQRIAKMKGNVYETLAGMSGNVVALLGNVGHSHIHRLFANMMLDLNEGNFPVVKGGNVLMKPLSMVSKSYMTKSRHTDTELQNKKAKMDSFKEKDSEKIQKIYKTLPCPSKDGAGYDELFSSSFEEILERSIPRITIKLDNPPKKDIESVAASIGGKITRDKDGSCLLSIRHDKLKKENREKVGVDRKLIKISPDDKDKTEKTKWLKQVFCAVPNGKEDEFIITFPVGQQKYAKLFVENFSKFKDETKTIKAPLARLEPVNPETKVGSASSSLLKEKKEKELT